VTRFAISRLGEARVASPVQLPGSARFTNDSERILVRPYVEETRSALLAGEEPPSFEVAGPRERLFFDPPRVRAGIVTCGGLSPGLNDVIRALVLQLWDRYGVRSILGLRNGYWGLSASPEEESHSLTPETVSGIHEQGGTILGTSRGTPAVPEAVDSVERLGLDVLFVVGGDGSMRGAHELCQEIAQRRLAVAVVGLPKTIDNDIPYVRRSFGFETAVTMASQAVRAAHTEAKSVYHGIGLVKLMGRYSGYVAANATLASGHVDFCLVPEVPFGFDGERGLLALLERTLDQRRYAVLVVAEGAGQEHLPGARGRDPSGNLELGDIGAFLRERLREHFGERRIPVALKYIDPSYLIRAAPANSSDSLFCARLGQHAVHAAMAGKTGMLVGFWHGQMTHVPLAAVADATKTIHPQGELWLNVLETTGQPARIG
jgi:6-phosphofructokinase 1